MSESEIKAQNELPAFLDTVRTLTAEEQLARLSPETTPPRFQQRVLAWGNDCLGEAVMANPEERALRFLEEALELCQACGVEPKLIDQMRHRVYSNEPGVVWQELGGVALSVVSLADVYRLDFMVQGERELARVLRNTDEIRAKQVTKLHAESLDLNQD